MKYFLCDASLPATTSARVEVMRPCESASSRGSVDSLAHLGVNQPESLPGFLLGQAFELEKVHHLLGDTDGGRSTTEENDTVVLQRLAGCFARLTGGSEESTEDDGTGTAMSEALLWRATALTLEYRR